MRKSKSKQRRLVCPRCRGPLAVQCTKTDSGSVTRYRACASCGARYKSVERVYRERPAENVLHVESRAEKES